MARFAAFGREVKRRLLKLERLQKWLIQQVKGQTELFLDNGYMYKILTGQRDAPEIVRAICEILGLPEELQSAMAGRCAALLQSAEERTVKIRLEFRGSDLWR